jgi:hypothetical protein
LKSVDMFELAAITQVSTDLKIANPQWLIDLINFESGFDPFAKNPYSSARGLIQFIDSTARDLGYKDSLDLVNQNPSVEKQIYGPVKKYLSRYAPFPTETSLYMAVFFPAARKYPDGTPFSKIFMDVYGVDRYEAKYKEFIKANPRILTPADYVSFLKKKALSSKSVLVQGSYLLLY